MSGPASSDVCTEPDRRADPDLRTVLGHFATGVTVVAAAGPHGPVGMTVSAFSSVCLDPPLILTCLGLGSRRAPVLLAADRFTVTFLGRHQRGLAEDLAAGPDGWAESGIDLTADGTPRPVDGLGYLECRRHDVVVQGDHAVLFGLVTGAHLLARSTPPLIRHRGRFT